MDIKLTMLIMFVAFVLFVILLNRRIKQLKDRANSLASELEILLERLRKAQVALKEHEHSHKDQ